MERQAIQREIEFIYEPRDYQVPFLRYMAQGGNRALLCWHRRAGKDLCALNMTVTKAIQRVGTYFLIYPTLNQGRRILWDGITGGDPDKGISGVPFLSYIPAELIPANGKNEVEMQITLTNGSIIQVVGVDRVDSIVGTNPVGCVFSEYGLHATSRAWDLVRPILAENGGWAVFISTPRGRNHFFQLYQSAEKEQTDNGSWFSQILTVNDTKKPNGAPVVTQTFLDSERRTGMDEDLLQQEYFCSFTGSQQGSYYGKQLTAARNEGRIRLVPWIPNEPVITAWDLGWGDANAIWFAQVIQGQVRLIDFEMANHLSAIEWAKVIKSKPYVYTCHILPHDGKVHEWGSGDTRKQTLEKLGVRPCRVLDKYSVADRIDSVRSMLLRSVFDAEKCDLAKHQIGSNRYSGMHCLTEYRKEYDEAKGSFKDTPVHNWASNGADSLGYLALGLKWAELIPDKQTDAISDFNPLSESRGFQQEADNDFNVFNMR